MKLALFSDTWNENPGLLEELVAHAKADEGTVFAETTQDIGELNHPDYVREMHKRGYDAIIGDINGDKAYFCYQIHGKNLKAFYFYLPEEAGGSNVVIEFARNCVEKIRTMGIAERVTIGGKGHKLGRTVCRYLSRKMGGVRVDVENQTVDFDQQT